MVVRRFPGVQSGRRKARRRRVFIVFKHGLFNDLVSNLLESSPEVEMVGHSDELQGAVGLIEESKAETVVVEGNPTDSRDLSLLNYLLVASNGAQWVELVMLSIESNQFLCFYRGSVKHLDTKRLLSLVLAG